MTCIYIRRCIFCWVVFLVGVFSPLIVQAQKNTASQPPVESTVSEVPEQIDIEPAAADETISFRLTRILTATGWFEQPQVSVDEGVVFLEGGTATLGHKEWAGRLAGNTQGVVAVVNRIEVGQPSMWDLSPAWRELRKLAAAAVRQSPLIGFGLFLLALTWLASKWTAGAAGTVLRHRVKSSLLRSVVARAVAVPVFLLGLYMVLRISGLTRLAVTVIGGTGLFGLVIGFAFRDIVENFLASLLLSMQKPFARNDLIEVAGYKGFVQNVNTRSTLLMTLEGNHVQIPNATIYKGTITNFTANPNVRFDFSVGIGYEDSISQAQSIALAVAQDHPAVVDDPEPLVLVESLGSSTVNLRVLCWVDITRYSQYKVRSAVIRLTKKAFERADISMPDEAREVVFPQGVPVQMVSREAVAHSLPRKIERPETPEISAVHSAEGDLSSEAGEIEEQARHARLPEGGRNLLEDEL